MPDLPNHEIPSPPLSSSFSTGAHLLNDAVISYRRSQTFRSGSNITSASDAFPEAWLARTTRLEDEEEEIDEREYREDDRVHGAGYAEDWMDPMWDDAVQPVVSPVVASALAGSAPLLLQGSPVGLPAGSTERTPLLLPTRRMSLTNDVALLPAPPAEQVRARRVPRKQSSNSLGVKYHYGGKSTFGQTLFNTVGILLGIGMLSEPLAFACAGWGAGVVLIVFYGFTTCYTAKILARIILADPSLRTYADIGHKAFGQKSIAFTSLFFCLELFALSVLLVTLYADSLHLMIPVLSSNQYKVLGLVVIIPTIFLPLSVLSYASILGIISTISLVACMFIDGFSKREAPGSLWQFSETDWGIHGLGNLGVAFGLFMAGFGGHAVVPSLARDMADPSQFDKAMNLGFAIATVIYGIIGATGYLMFGKSVSQEFSQDILATPGYNAVLNKIAVWMLVITPLTKFALSFRPLNLTFEIWLGIDERAKPPSCPVSSTTGKSAATLGSYLKSTSRPWLLILERILLAISVVVVSILVPEFSMVMALLGSFTSFVLNVIGPVCAKIALRGKCAWYDGVLLVVAIVMAAWGTHAAFANT